MASTSPIAIAAIAAIATIAIRVKELMAKMPDTLNTKKDIDEYYKKIVKDAKEAINEEKKANNGGKAPRKALGVKPAKVAKAAKAAKAEPKKRVKKANVDADGNEIEKVKKPPNAYQKFIQDNRAKVKEENPDMTGVEIFTLLAQKWNEHKKAMNDDESNDEDKDDGKGSKSSSSGKKDTSDDDDITEDDDDKKKAAVAKSVKASKAKNAINKKNS
jgi:hypothetical protein